MLLSNQSIQLIIANLIILFFGMGLHEYAHSYVAYRMGDPTPKEMGRLTLNPFAHIYWPGWVMMAIIGFGFLGFAPINPYRMRNPRWGSLAAVAAGPLSNLALALIIGIMIRILNRPDWIYVYARPDLVRTIPDFVTLLFVQAVYLNIAVCMISFVPLFPLDGWHVVFALLPPDMARTWERHRQTTTFIFIALFLISFLNIPGIPNVLDILVGQPTAFFFRLFMGF